MVIKFRKSEYTNQNGWSITEEKEIDEKTAIQYAASANRGNANLSTSPEEWAENMIMKKNNFKIYKTPEILYEFEF